jgi:amino acid transporter
MVAIVESDGSEAASGGGLIRSLDWKGAFWVAAGVPPLVLFSIGGIAGTTGKLAFVVWIISMVMGFLQSFTYAEIAGMCAIAAGYILNSLFPIPAADSQMVIDWISAHAASVTADSPRVAEWLAANAGKSPQDAISALLSADGVAAFTPAIRNWSLITFDIPFLAKASLNATFVIGGILMLIIFAIQHRGILGTASVQKWLAIIVLVPLLVIGLFPIFSGQIDMANVTNLLPPTAAYAATDGTWSNGGWTLFLGGLYIAAWSTYGFETAVCYTRELKNPKTDTFKAIFYSGLLCCLFFFLIPFTFQGVLGHSGMLAPGIVDGSGVAEALAGLVHGGKIVTQLLVVLMIMALILAIMTAMAGSSRTLYQGSKDGWLPKYLDHVNEHGAPTRAMWTDFAFNLMLLAIASDVAGYFFVLAVSNVGYIIFNFLNLNAGWIHRMDSGHVERPWKAPTWLIGLNTVLAFVNALFLGAGAKVWGYSNALWVGFIFAALILPVFAYRHFVRDGGKFPDGAMEDLGLVGQDLGVKRAGILPYVALAAGLVVVLAANVIFQLPA